MPRSWLTGEKLTDRESLLAIVSERRRAYMLTYVVQMMCWVGFAIWNETEQTQSFKAHVLDVATTTSFITAGALVSTILLVDLVKDVLIPVGRKIMGLFFTPVKNKWEAEAEARGEERANTDAAAWYKRMEHARREGREFNEPPPFLDRDHR